MKWFEISNLTLDVCSSISREWMYNVGYNITEPSWSIRPYKIPQEELFHISPICDIIPVKMDYAALIMTPANTICKTHVDNIGGRNTAINIPINVEANSLFQYMDGDKIIENIDTSIFDSANEMSGFSSDTISDLTGDEPDESYYDNGPEQEKYYFEEVK